MRRRGTRLPAFLRPVVPDRLDLRDRPYRPAIATAPAPERNSLEAAALPVHDQGETSACTGFALANVVNYLLRTRRRDRDAEVSAFMLYSMARRYDEFPGADRDAGSSLRGALKGWYKHGACSRELWRGLTMPPPKRDATGDWWQEAANRPLGAYYRVDARSVTDMHVALDEVGVLYASALCHPGWDALYHAAVGRRKPARIPFQKGVTADGGHAFVIVGYDRHGFLILNSWGRKWGADGLAVLTYEDWLDNAMDCWVAQLGVVTDQHREVAQATTLRSDAKGRVTLATERQLRNQEIAPFIVNMENNGRLSRSGDFRTNPADLDALWKIHFREARRRWGLERRAVDVAVYAHGGLTDEDAAANTAARWIPALYDARIFPVFLMWETDLWSTLTGRLADFLHGEPRRTGGPRDAFLRFWNERLERGLAAPGTELWTEMKQNAAAISLRKGGSERHESGGRLLYRAARRAGIGPREIRLHLVGHSAGSIVHCHLARALAALRWRFESVHFLAPAVRADTFAETLLPLVRKGHVRRYHQYHLTDEAERQDPTCRPLLGYGRSLLWLVSESFERGVRTPILGMQRYFDAEVGALGLGRVEAVVAPSQASASTTHGGFDDDPLTLRAVIERIRGRGPRLRRG